METTPNGASGGDSFRKKESDKARLSLSSLKVNALKTPGVAPQGSTQVDNAGERQKDTDDIRHIDSVLECSPVDVDCNGALCETPPRRESVDNEITCDCPPMPTT